MTIEFSSCIICVNHFSCQEIYLCTLSHALTHNHDAHHAFLVENLQCNTEGVTTRFTAHSSDAPLCCIGHVQSLALRHVSCSKGYSHWRPMATRAHSASHMIGPTGPLTGPASPCVRSLLREHLERFWANQTPPASEEIFRRDREYAKHDRTHPTPSVRMRQVSSVVSASRFSSHE